MNWFYILVGYIGLFVYGLVENARGPVFPEILTEFGLSDSEGALFFVVSSTAALLNNVVFFRLMERIGTLRTMQAYSALQFVSLIGIGLAASFRQTLAGSLCLGICFGGLGIAVNLIVSEGSSPEKRRRALSGLHSMYGISSLLAPLLVTLLYEQGLSWREVLAAVAVGPALVLAVSFSRAGRIEPLAAKPDGAPKTAPARPWRAAVFFSFVVALYVIAEVGASTRLVLYARREAGYSMEAANFLLSAFFMGLLLGRALLAIFHLPLGSRAILVLSASTSLVCLSLGLTRDPAWMAASGLTMSVFYPTALSLVAERLGQGAGFATSMVIIFQSLGLVAMHAALGALSDGFGLGKALWMGPVCLALALLLLSLERFFPREKAVSP